MSYDQKSVIGTCSICGGDVIEFNYLMIVGKSPNPQCKKCGAVKKVRHTILMVSETG